MTRLAGQVVLVTGASHGIGRATAVAMGREGAAVGVNYRTDEVAAESAADEVRAAGGRAATIRADVGDADQAARLVEQTIASLGDLDVVVNNAGISVDQLIYDLGPDSWLETMRTNFGSVVNVTRAAIEHFFSKREGAIVNVSSSFADRADYGASMYAASKAAVNAFTRACALEFGRFGVRVNAVAPGIVETQLIERQLGDARAPGLRNHIPLRSFGRAENVADVIVFLASPAAAYMTGTIVPIDGGLPLAIGLSTARPAGAARDRGRNPERS